MDHGTSVSVVSFSALSSILTLYTLSRMSLENSHKLRMEVLTLGVVL